MRPALLLLLATLAAPLPLVRYWQRPRFDPEASPLFERADLPRVLLIGDSIARGYTPAVRRLLAAEANVHRVPENARSTAYGIERLGAWLGRGRWDVVHFNFGLHDLARDEQGRPQVPPAEYEANLRALAARLRATGAQLVWASTTPVPDAPLLPPRKSEDVVAYNDLARRVMAQSHVQTLDLYAVALPRLARIQQPDDVHFTPAGSEVLASAVADAIRAALAQRKAHKGASVSRGET